MLGMMRQPALEFATQCRSCHSRADPSFISICICLRRAGERHCVPPAPPAQQFFTDPGLGRVTAQQTDVVSVLERAGAANHSGGNGASFHCEHQLMSRNAYSSVTRQSIITCQSSRCAYPPLPFGPVNLARAFACATRLQANPPPSVLPLQFPEAFEVPQLAGSRVLYLDHSGVHLLFFFAWCGPYRQASLS